MTSPDDDRDLRSYGRRRGRKGSPRQEALKRDLLPRVALDLTAPSGRLPAGKSEGPLSGVSGDTPPSRRPPSTAPSCRLAERESEGPLSDVSGDTPSSRRPPSTAPSGRLAERESEGPLSGVSGDTPPSRRPPSTAPSGRLAERESEGAIEIWLEIGFGGGEHLVWQAAHNPHVLLIGCEPFEDGVVKVLSTIEQDKLENIRLHMGDARDVLRWLRPASVSRAFILFPDPWPKRKHRKRRLVNPATLKLLARIMKPGAELRIGTDIGDYARTMLQAFRTQSDFAWQAQSSSDWRVRPPDWPQTRYEQKAARDGRVRYYFRYLRV